MSTQNGRKTFFKTADLGVMEDRRGVMGGEKENSTMRFQGVPVTVKKIVNEK